MSEFGIITRYQNLNPYEIQFGFGHALPSGRPKSYIPWQPTWDDVEQILTENPELIRRAVANRKPLLAIPSRYVSVTIPDEDRNSAGSHFIYKQMVRAELRKAGGDPDNYTSRRTPDSRGETFTSKRLK